MNRNEHLRCLARQDFDLLVIGGGISGACIAHDAALRGLSVALIERRDFGGFTSAASSKLLHGGIRYLPQAQLWKVRESGREQRIMQRLAPHLLRWLPFLVPTEKGSFMQGALPMQAAMQIYGLCHAGFSDLPSGAPLGEFLPPDKAVRVAPQLASIAKLSGAQVLNESHMHSSERMTLAFLKTAASNGAAIANYVEAISYLSGQSRVRGAVVRNVLSGKEFSIAARMTINSSGPAVQALNRAAPSLQLRLRKEITGFARGVHLVTRQIHPDYALALTTREKTEGFVTRGGRHFFIIPWRGRSLIGTTNTPFKGDFDQLRVTAEDVDEFLADINETLPDLGLRREEVYYAYVGIYPLTVRVIDPEKYQAGGDYQLIDHHSSDGVAGLITSLGAKYTTARGLAEKTVNMAVRKLGCPAYPCRTAATPLLEGSMANLAAFTARKQEQYSALLTKEMAEHLIRYYGTEIDRVMETAAGDAELLLPLSSGVSVCAAEVLHAVRQEMAAHLDDVIFRRTGMGTIGCPDETALNRAAAIMAAELDWDAQRTETEKAEVLSRYAFRQASPA
ncbi:MAG: FAD-dependent oxidoreductase [Candidatus Electronema sp. V4]|uniref:FAD-dependent oxidoreductase n=1 Tax=Candidatus Electronema sp. V4 TaxID=3454756 RepID=UPI0040559759